MCYTIKVKRLPDAVASLSLLGAGEFNSAS